MSEGWAIVGTGAFAANRIAPALNRALGSRLAAVVSRDRARAEEFAAEHETARAYDDIEAAVRDPAVSCVWVATPHSLHRDPVLAAARAGKHVLCEKPLATTRADAREMIRACRRAGVLLGTGFHLRHHPLHREVRRLVASGELGDVLFAESEWSTAVPRSGRGYNAAWRADPALAYAGITTGTGVHIIDLLRFVLDDEIAAISAMTDADSSPVNQLETRAVATLRFTRGTLATLRCLRGIPRPENDLVVVGKAGRVAARHSIDETTHGTLEVDGVDTDVYGVPAGFDMYVAQVESFMDAMREGREPSASGEDGLRAVEALDALLESARTGQTISLE